MCDQWRNQLFALGPPTCYLVSADLGPLHLDRCNPDQWALEKASCWIRTIDLRSCDSGLAPHDTHITNTRESALEFLTAQTTRLPRRLGTRGHGSFSIPESGEVDTFAWKERC